MGGWCVGERAADVAGEDFSHVLEGREERGLTQAARSFWERLISRGEPGAR